MAIYFDNAATTHQNEEVTKEMNTIAIQEFYNAAALYPPSLSVKNKVQHAGNIIKRKLTKSSQGELIFTSGATESNNMVIFGKVNKRTQILCLEGEHSSIYTPVKHLKDNGYAVSFIPLQRNGMADTAKIVSLLKNIYPESLVLFGLVNSDTGTIQDAKSIVQNIRAICPTAHIHCDATQAFCKIPFDVVDLDLDSLSISAHKIHGAKGVGALWIKSSVHLNPIMFGGGQQTIRPGTENTPGTIGFGVAVEIYDTEKNFAIVSNLHTRLIKKLPSKCAVNGINNNPYITNIQLPNIFGQTVLNALAGDGIFVGLGSACMGTDKNRTLVGMGIPESKTKQVIRISFNPENTLAEVDTFIERLNEWIDKLSGKIVR